MAEDRHHQRMRGPSWIECVLVHSGTPADRRNQYRFLAWWFAWGVAFVAAGQALDSGRVEGAAAWVLAVVPAVLAVAAFLAYLRFLRRADELVQRIQLDALAFGFAVAVLLGLGYPLFEQAGAPDFDISDLAVAMLVAFAVGQVFASYRYR